MATRRIKTKGESMIDALTVFEHAGRKFLIRRGLCATMEDVTVKSADLATAYAVQKAWYDANGQREPDRVRARREAWEQAPVVSRIERKAKTGTYSIAVLVRGALGEGKDTDAVIAAVKAILPDAKIDSKTVAFYRHQLKKENAK